MTRKRFNIAVEDLVVNKNFSYIDAMTHVIESRGMDYSNIKKRRKTRKRSNRKRSDRRRTIHKRSNRKRTKGKL